LIDSDDLMIVGTNDQSNTNKMELSGSLRIGERAADPDPMNGGIRHDTTENRFEAHENDEWRCVVNGADAIDLNLNELNTRATTLESKVDQKLNVDSDVNFNSTSTTGGAVVNGDLVVQGTTTTINGNQVDVNDGIVKLNSDEVGAPTQNAGLEIERGTPENEFLTREETKGVWSANDDDLEVENLTTTGTIASSTIDDTKNDIATDASNVTSNDTDVETDGDNVTTDTANVSNDLSLVDANTTDVTTNTNDIVTIDDELDQGVKTTSSPSFVDSETTGDSTVLGSGSFQGNGDAADAKISPPGVHCSTRSDGRPDVQMVASDSQSHIGWIDFARPNLSSNCVGGIDHAAGTGVRFHSNGIHCGVFNELGNLSLQGNLNAGLGQVTCASFARSGSSVFTNDTNSTNHSTRNDAGDSKIAPDNDPIVEFQENDSDTLRLGCDTLDVAGHLNASAGAVFTGGAVNSMNSSPGFHLGGGASSHAQIVGSDDHAGWIDWVSTTTGSADCLGRMDHEVSTGTSLVADSSHRMTMSPTGNVGIGKTDPDQRLDVLGNAKISGTMRIGDQSSIANSRLHAVSNDGGGTQFTAENLNATTGRAGVQLKSNGKMTQAQVDASGSFGVSNCASNTNVTFATTGATAHFVVPPNNTGNMGVGTDDPRTKLEVEEPERLVVATSIIWLLIRV